MKKPYIFFDYGRTVVEHPGDANHILTERGIADPDVKTVREIIFSMDRYLNDLDEGTLPREVYHESLKKQLPPHLLEAALGAADYHIGELQVLPGMEELLTRLKEKGFKLFITSNMDELHSAQMAEVPVTKYFDGMLFSSEVKARKPSAAFFKAALDRFGAKPEECLFIDDLAENVAGAAKCGIKGLVFSGDAAEAERFIDDENGL